MIGSAPFGKVQAGQHADPPANRLIIIITNYSRYRKDSEKQGERIRRKMTTEEKYRQ